MKKILRIDDYDLFYTLRQNSRSKNIIIKIVKGSEIRVSTPTTVSLSYIESFIRSKYSWIKKNLSESASVLSSDKAKAMYKANRKIAYDLVMERILHFNEFYQLAFGKVSVKNQTSLWGSCSKDGNLNFNYKIVFLPPELADYIIVHELCHLKEFNHSKSFWDLVALTIPDYKRRLSLLKTYEYGIY